MMQALIRELADAVRGVARRPRATILPAAILAVAFALSATVFSVIQGVLLRGLPVRGGDRFLIVSTEERPFAGTPSSDVEALRAASREAASAFDGIATSVALNFMLTGEGRGTVSRTGSYVSADLFELLGVEPLLGRAIVPADGDPAAPAVAVLGHGFWQSYFGGDEGVLGQRLVVNRTPTTIVGVMPPGFGFPYRQELWTVHRQADMAWDADAAAVFSRLARGASLAQARSELELLASRLDADDPRSRPRTASVTPFIEAVVDPATRRALGILLVAVAGVLVVACANAANLRLASALARRRELAVRSALGAGRGRLATLLVAETAVIALLGAIGGLGLAWLLVEEAGRALLQGSLLRGFWMDVRLDATVLAVTAAIAAGAVLLVGALPAWLATGRGAVEDLRAGARVQRTASRAFVALQVGLCFALMVGAGSLGRNALGLLRVEPGFDPDRLLTAWVSLFQDAEASAEDRAVFYRELVRRLEARPEIEEAALGSGPVWGWAPPTEFARAADGAAAESWPTVPVLSVSPGYLETVRLPILAGRSIEATDLDAPERPAVVSASFARRWLGGVGEAVGRRLTLREGDQRPTVTVVGVAADVGMARLQEDPNADEKVYLGMRVDRGGSALLMRTRGDDEAALDALGDELAALDPLAATYNASSFARDRATSSWEQRRLAQLLVVFGIAALLLAAGGLYSVVDLAGRRRRRELGLRLALGAAPRQVRGLVMREGVVQVAGGLAIGLAALMLLAPALRQFLVRSTVWDPWMVGLGVAVLGATALLATAGPARRAARLDPAETLRAE
ncbi:MAG TPA: ABC transporter permease [Thermoanaerobaculia bacterium]|nr:ABC transporter permease [Thermoanaerobaculia bacterium]